MERPVPMSMILMKLKIIFTEMTLKKKYKRSRKSLLGLSKKTLETFTESNWTYLHSTF
jgi:hypothetical protein